MLNKVSTVPFYHLFYFRVWVLPSHSSYIRLPFVNNLVFVFGPTFPAHTQYLLLRATDVIPVPFSLNVTKGVANCFSVYQR